MDIPRVLSSPALPTAADWLKGPSCLTLTLLPCAHCGGGGPFPEGTGAPTWLPPARLLRNRGAPPAMLLTEWYWDQAPRVSAGSSPARPPPHPHHGAHLNSPAAELWREKGTLTNQNEEQRWRFVSLFRAWQGQTSACDLYGNADCCPRIVHIHPQGSDFDVGETTRT